MDLPDWRTLALLGHVLAEPVSEQGRLVLWVRRHRAQGHQHWERISTAPRVSATTEDGICRVSAVAVPAQEVVHGWLRRWIWGWWKRQPRGCWQHPHGTWAAPDHQRRSDVLLIWAIDGRLLDCDVVQTRWPSSTGVEQLGPNLVVVRGLALNQPMQSPLEPPGQHRGLREMAEKMVQDARRQHDPAREVTASIDLALVLSQEGHCEQAIDMLEEALALAQQIKDGAKERDALGNLGNLLIAKDRQRALAMLQQELALARAANDPYAEATALHHVGVYHLRAGNAELAFAHLQKALALARHLGDRQHEADLLWLLSIQYADVGQRDEACDHAQRAIDMHQGKPQATILSEHLERYRTGHTAGIAEAPNAAPDLFSQSHIVVAGGWTKPKATEPSLLRKGFSAAKALARFLGSGIQRVPPEVYQQRQQTCGTCDQHTGLRCRVCGCFTSVKAWLPHEECPLKKWPADSKYLGA